MKADHLLNWSRLAKWLFIVALLCSLFACLGGDVSSQDRLRLSPKTELVLATEQALNKSESVKQAQELSWFSTACKLNRLRALIAYNKWIRYKITIFCLSNFTYIRLAQFVQLKAIPANSNKTISDLLRD